MENVMSPLSVNLQAPPGQNGHRSTYQNTYTGNVRFCVGTGFELNKIAL
jgi:hypothetical protein